MLMDCKSTRTNQWTVSKRSVRKTRAATGHSAWLEMSTEVVGAILGGDASERRHAKRPVHTCRKEASYAHTKGDGFDFCSNTLFVLIFLERLRKMTTFVN